MNNQTVSPAISLDAFFHSSSYAYLTEWQQKLLRVSFELCNRQAVLQNLDDYGFLIFSAAKAYEGILKKLLFDLFLISNDTFQSRRFRIGRALNPDLHPDQRDNQWFYDDLSRICGQEVARQMWQTWLRCRNHIFHFFPGGKEQINLAEALSLFNILCVTIDLLIQSSGVLEKSQPQKQPNLVKSAK